MEDLQHDNRFLQFPAVPQSPLSDGPPGRPPTGGSGSYPPDPLIDLIIETLGNLDATVQGSFLQKFLTGLTNTNLSESDSIGHWQGILRRRRELTERLGRPISLRTAAVDYFDETSLLRNHILIEYLELKRLRHTVSTDPLTGLYNRRYFQECLAREVKRSTRYASPLALVVFDLRSLKFTNDTYGHPVGDEILCGVARACGETIRGSDIPCRIGGDEFAILLPESDRSSAEGLAQRIAAKFEEYAKPLAPKIDVGLDYGVASYPADGENETKLFEAADRSLYANKQKAYEQKHGVGTGAVPPSPEITSPGQRFEMEVTEQAGQPAERPKTELAAPLPGEEVSPLTVGRAPLRRQSRRSERISLERSRGLALLHIGCTNKLARVLDMSLGGLCLLVDEAAELPNSFNARLRVPFLPRAEFTLYRVYSRSFTGNRQRIGCSFAPVVRTSTAAPEPRPN